MKLEELIEEVLSKWSQRGYIEEEMVGTIAADLYGEVWPRYVRARLALERIDDAFCDIYAENRGGAIQGDLGRAIDRLHDWRERNGMTYEPFEGSAPEREDLTSK